VLDHIKRRFAARNLPMPKNNEVQALVPEDALVLANPNGTAPGLAMKTDEDGRGNSDKSRAGMENGGTRAPSSTFNPPASRSPKWLVMLPGPPRELRPDVRQFCRAIAPARIPAGRAFVCRTLRTSGIAESLVQEKLKRR